MEKKIETEEEKKAREFVEATAQAIIDLAESVRRLLGGRLNKTAIVLLLSRSSRLSQEDVTRVLTAITNLDKTYLK